MTRHQQRTYLRRRWIAIWMVIAAFGMVTAGDAQARDFSKVQIKGTELAKGIHMLTGSGGNLGLSTGADGTFLVDDQFAPLTDKIVNAVGQITPLPIKFVVNTHWHFDHTGGNENLGKVGTIIVAHDNVRETMSADRMLTAFNRLVPASPKGALPVITFSDTTTFHMNGQTILIRHLPSAHTSGDSIVHFKEADVIHTGDIFFNGFYPFIDTDHGGSIDGLIAATGAILKTGGSEAKIIPGHGPLASKADLKAYRAMLMGVRDAIRPLIAAGKSKADVIAADPLAEISKTWGKGFLKPEAFTGIAYAALK